MLSEIRHWHRVTFLVTLVCKDGIKAFAVASKLPLDSHLI